MVPLDVLSVAPLTIQSLPLISLVTIPWFHRFLFLFSSFMIRTSLTLRWHVCSPPARRYCSRRLHSRDHLFNMTSLHLIRFLACVRRSFSGAWCAYSSSKQLGPMCTIECRVRTGSSMPSSKADRWGQVRCLAPLPQALPMESFLCRLHDFSSSFSSDEPFQTPDKWLSF